MPVPAKAGVILMLSTEAAFLNQPILEIPGFYFLQLPELILISSEMFSGWLLIRQIIFMQLQKIIILKTELVLITLMEAYTDQPMVEQPGSIREAPD